MSETTVNTFCPYCDTEVVAPIRPTEETVTVRGESITYTAHIAYCPMCNEAIGDSRVEQKNQDVVFGIYRERHGIPTVQRLKQLRHEYGLSIREFSLFLGFGEQTYARYERGDLPDELHNSVLHLAFGVDGAEFLLKQNESRISERSRIRVQTFIENHRLETPIICHYDDCDDEVLEMTDLNGYRAFDRMRFIALVCILACECKSLYWTKLQKALYMVEMYAFCTQARSIAGLEFVHGHYGPMMKDREIKRSILVEQAPVEFCEDGSTGGEVVSASCVPDHDFTAQELEIIHTVAAFVNTFTTASQISEFSHSLSAWKDTFNGETMAYGATDEELYNAIQAKLFTH